MSKGKLRMKIKSFTRKQVAVFLTGIAFSMLPTSYAAENTHDYSHTQRSSQMSNLNTPSLNNLVAYADAYFDVWNKKDYDAVARFYTEDIIYRDVNLGSEVKGHDELKKFMKQQFDLYPDLHFKTLEVMKEGEEKLAIRWEMTGTYEGDKFNIEGVSIMRLKNGKVAWNSDYYK